MKRSQFVAIGIVQAVAAAALAAGCGSTKTTSDWENCVDREDRVVSDQHCQDERSQAGRAGFVPFYHSYYTRGAAPLPIGQRAVGGTLTRPGSGLVRPSSSSPSVTRGGFGSTGSAHPSGGT